MMDVLLDTCSFLWIITDAEELSQHAREIFSDSDNTIYLSAVSEWEIAVKYKLKKLTLPKSPATFLPQQRMAHGINPLDLDEEAALTLLKLPELHKDPFDRMLICQAISHGLTILTPDENIRQYPVKTIW
jgi:PIN domain nuclease of toxin-antitoxin system